MGDTDNSDFGSDGFGKNWIYHVIPDAIRVPKMVQNCPHCHFAAILAGYAGCMSIFH